MLCRAALFCIIAPVPRGQIPVHTVRVHHSRQDFRIRVGLRLCRLPDLHQQVAHGSRCFGHFSLKLVIGKAVITQQRRTLFAQRQCFGRDRTVVCLATVRAPRLPSLERALAQVAARAELQERRDQRAR